MALQDVLLSELRDLYSAENQLVKAMPKVAKQIESDEMKTIFTEHMEETKTQVDRLKEIFGILGKKATGQHCNGMEGVVEEAKEALEEDEEGAAFDAGIIGASLRLEHYEIAGYTAAIAIAKALGEKDVVALLNETLKEETTAAKNILAASKSILKEAASEGEDDEEEEEDEDQAPKDAKELESEHESEEDEAEAQPELAKLTGKPAKKSAKAAKGAKAAKPPAM